MGTDSFQKNHSAIDSLNEALLLDSNWQVALHAGENPQRDALGVYRVQPQAKRPSCHQLLGLMPLGILPGHLLACFDIAARYYRLGFAHGKSGVDWPGQEPKFNCD